MQSERKKLQKELAEHLRDKDLAQLRLLRSQIGAARVERRSRLIRARVQCRTAREQLKERQAAERERLLLEHRDQRVQGKTACELGKEQAKREGLELERGAKRTLKEERIYQRRIRQAGKPVKVRATARDAQAVTIGRGDTPLARSQVAGVSVCRNCGSLYVVAVVNAKKGPALNR